MVYIGLNRNLLHYRNKGYNFFCKIMVYQQWEESYVVSVPEDVAGITKHVFFQFFL